MSPQEESMKKLLLLLIALTFLTVSCSSSKKTENDTDLLPDEDEISDEDAVEPDEDENDEDAVEPDEDENDEDNDHEESQKNENWEKEPDTGSPCENFANKNGLIRYNEDGSFECGCLEGYFWGHPGCKRIAFPNFCTESNVCYSYSYTDCPDLHYAKLGYCIKHSLSTDESVADEPVVVDDYLKIEWMPDFSDGPYTWYEAAEYCEKLEYAGHDDWRLPTTQELMFIDNASDEHGVLDLWSSTEYVKNESSAWTLNSNRNWQFWNKKEFTSTYFRCVRGEPVNETVSFETLGKIREKVAFDYGNGLAWQLYGGAANSFTDALEYCDNSDYSGFSDWRLPNINELASLVNHAKINLATDLPLHLTRNLSWTLTSRYGSEAGAVNFRNGELELIYKDEDNPYATTDTWANILCVRNEPCRKGWFWNGRKCIPSPCTGEPCKNEKHSDGVCYLNDFESHECGCVEDYFWDGVKCVSPCDPNPCGNDKNSTGECLAISIDLHECGCIEGYFWDGFKCINPCAGVSCGDFEHAKGKCKAENAFIYSCGCEEGYYWHGKEKGCLEERPYAVNICTGQNKCYDNEKEILCPAENEEFFGQDAQYARLGYCVPQSFSIDDSVEDEPVVIDNNLGLMWQRNIPPVEELYIENVRQYCKDLVYGGYDDWRLPSMEDFMTIADYGRYDPAVDTGYFPDSGKFWTSTIENYIDGLGLMYVIYEKHCTIFDFNDPSATYVVTFYSDQGLTNSSEDRAYSFNIRCIRGETNMTPPYHFTSETFGNNIRWNNYNDLIFTKADKKQTWQEALKYCSELDYAGISDWRVPNVKELTLNSFGGSRSSTTKPADPASDYSSLPYDLPAKEEKTADTFCVANDPCGKGKFWNGVKCAKNPCADDPCQSVYSSSKVCVVVDEENYVCDCNEKYFWNPDKQVCLRSCEDNPCQYPDNSDHTCYPDDNYGYYCGCNEPYFWNFDSKRCIKNCEADTCKDEKYSTGECFNDETKGYYCGCIEGYHWDTSTSISRCKQD